MITHELLAEWRADPATGPFWDALDGGELCLPRCSKCEMWWAYVRRVCPACGAVGTKRWETLSGQGRVYSVTLQHRTPEGWDMPAPFQVALVTLREGPSVLAPVVPPEIVAIGDSVVVGSREAAGLGRLPAVRLGAARSK